MNELVISFNTMMQILTKVFGIFACNKKNGFLHETLPQQWAEGHFSSTPHFVLTAAYLHEYTIVLVCSFLTEYNNHFIPRTCPELKDRIIEFRKKIKPVLDKINKWSDLEKYRNTILAHNLRFKNKESIFEENIDKIKFNIPNTQGEFRLLVQLCGLITQNIGVEFPELTEKIDFNSKMIDKFEVPYEIIDMEIEFNKISNQIKKLGLTKTQQTHP